VVAGNIPYYITSPILERIFASRQVQRAVLLVQAEVAARLVAEPGSRDYGYLTVFTQVHASVARLFEVPRTAFRPPPKVDSAVVRLEPRDAGAVFGIEDVPSFLKFTSACFRHKRKTLANNLIPVFGQARVRAAVDARVRAEQLGLAELARLHAALGI
jgi:16S rRNA (adenine1518-N6/adenine1519-N6)-dimethyltransferase